MSDKGTHDIMVKDANNVLIHERNAFLRAYAEENGFYLNDLYALVANSLDFPKSDYVHYTDEGAKRLGMHVADYLRKFL